MKCKNTWLLFLVLGVISCEKDDICIPTSPTTPRLILKTFNHADLSNSTSPPNFMVKPIGIEMDLPINNRDSILLPLRSDQSFTDFEFIMNHEQGDENIDTLRLNYRIEDKYLNRSCGFISTFILNNPPHEIINSGQNWIMEIKTLKDSIIDEQSAHLHLIF